MKYKTINIESFLSLKLFGRASMSCFRKQKGGLFRWWRRKEGRDSDQQCLPEQEEEEEEEKERNKNRRKRTL